MKAFKVFSLLIALTFIVISCNDDCPEEQGDNLISLHIILKVILGFATTFSTNVYS